MNASAWKSIKDLSVFHTGIVWYNVAEPHDDIFNEPWMQSLNQNLMYRYWKRKGCPGYMYTYRAGVKIWHCVVDDIGIISFVATPHWT